MYKDYFRLSEMPFSIAPDPRFLFMSDRHREALAHLLYGVQGEGGIVLLTGEVGTGKTTICRSMLEQLPDNIDVAFILNPLLSAEELLQTVCQEYHIPLPAKRPGIKALVDAIHARLLEANAQDRRAIVIIDEAQNLDPRVLEQLRLLTNLETNTRKLLQIILIGQPELQDLLAKPEMRQVAQRIIARYHLTQLNPHEVDAYVAHRLRISGAVQAIFPEHLAGRIHRATGGVPRLINLVCDRALLGAYAQGQQQVSAATLRQAVKEVGAARQTPRGKLAIAAVLVTLLGLAGLAAPSLSGWLPPPLPPSASAAPAQAVAANPAAHGRPADAGFAWPDSVARSDSERLAFQSLFGLHGIKDGATAGRNAPCRTAEELGMRCHVARGGVTDLLLLDQPAILRLVAAADGSEYSVLLRRLDRRQASLLIAGEERRIALADLAAIWSGNYVVLWKAPPGFGDELSPGRQGPEVRWLRQAMADIDGVPDDGSSVFDAALARRIRAFQLLEGVRPDGYVGPVTAIRLNARRGLAGPSLSDAKKG